MTFLHTSDLHIGIRLKNYDLREEQEDVFSQMIERVKEHRPDAFIIAGDIYDKSVPSAEAVHIFDDFITKLRYEAPLMPIMIISGNHDSQERVQCYGKILRHQGIYVAPLPKNHEEYFEKVELTDEYGKVNFYLIPFIKPAYVRNLFEDELLTYEEAFDKMLCRENINYNERNVIVSHQFFINESEDIERMPSEIVTVGNIDSISSKLIMDFDYGALGHIHKSARAGAEHLRYCGAPFPYSIDESGQEKGMLLVTLEDKESPAIIEKIPIKPLHNVRKIEGALENILKEKSDDFVSITLSDKEDLDTIHMQMKLKANFPRLCEIKREGALKLQYSDLDDIEIEENMDVFEMFCNFYKDITEEEKEIIKDVINKVREME